MELVSPLVFALFFIRGEWHEGFMPYFFLSLWMIHYLYRTFVFSTLLRGSISMPLVVIFFGMMFNSANGFLQSQYLYTFSLGPLKYSPTWLYSPQCIIGLVLFFAGFAIHVHADSVTRGLRERGENEYKIPYRGLYSYVSSPNYLGEIIQWCGWGLVTWSLPGIAFAFWTTANLLPRAMANHRWYRKTFTDYPEHRKALIPFIL
jgi:protein-S-isoprenylcysteine O-methyltransferase Ste14